MTRMGATLGETSEITGELNENMDGLETVIRDIAKQIFCYCYTGSTGR